jgi:hypothetical protein
LIEKYLTARLAALPDSDPDKGRLQSFLEVFRSEIHNAKNAHKIYEKLGLDADYLMHSDTLSAAINNYAGKDREKFRVFCFASYFKAVAHDPGSYTNKILTQFTHFLFPQPKTFFDDQMNPAKAYRESARCWDASGSASLRPELREMYGEYRRGIEVEIERSRTMAKYPLLRAARQTFARCALPVELLFLLAMTVCFIWPPLHHLRVGGWAACCLFLAPLGNAFGVCIVHTLDIYRYRVTYGGYLLFALVAMAAFIGIVFTQSLSHCFATRKARELA